MDESGGGLEESADANALAPPERFSSEPIAAEALHKALPLLKCPVCSQEKFNLLERMSKGLRTRLPLHFGSNPFPKEYYATLNVVCDNCGYILVFEETKIRELAEANKKIET